MSLIMEECEMYVAEKARLFLELIRENHQFPLIRYIEAASNFDNFEEAKRSLIQSCPICMDEYPKNEVSGSSI